MATNYARSISLTTVLVSNVWSTELLSCIETWVTLQKYMRHLNKSSQPCSHICHLYIYIYSFTRNAMALPLLNYLHCFKIHDQVPVILMVKSSIHNVSLNIVIALTALAPFVFRSNQFADDRAEDNDPSEWDSLSITWERISSSCNFVPSL